jgi:hypothetical protein
VGWVTRWLRCEKCVFRRKHRTEVTEATEGDWGGGSGLGDEIGKLWSAFFRPDHDLHAAIELLLVH